MANLIRSFHPHHQKHIVTFKDLHEWIENFFSNKYVLYKKWDGISSSISLDIETKKLGIKRIINKKPFNISQIEKYFSNKNEACHCFFRLLDVVNNNLSIFDILKLNLNPNLILLIEYIAPSLNIIDYKEEVYNIIGLSEIKGSILTPKNIDDSIYINICNSLNSVSNIKFVYNNKIDVDLSIYKKSFYDKLKKTYKVKNIKMQDSLYDILISDYKINRKYKNIYKKYINTNSISYYNKERYKFSYGLASTEIVVLLGEFLKLLTKCQNIEGFIFYDKHKEIYLKLVGNFIEKLKDSNFSNKKNNVSFKFISRWIMKNNSILKIKNKRLILEAGVENLDSKKLTNLITKPTAVVFSTTANVISDSLNLSTFVISSILTMFASDEVKNRIKNNYKKRRKKIFDKYQSIIRNNDLSGGAEESLFLASPSLYLLDKVSDDFKESGGIIGENISEFLDDPQNYILGLIPQLKGFSKEKKEDKVDNTNLKIILKKLKDFGIKNLEELTKKENSNLKYNERQALKGIIRL